MDENYLEDLKESQLNVPQICQKRVTRKSNAMFWFFPHSTFVVGLSWCLWKARWRTDRWCSEIEKACPSLSCSLGWWALTIRTMPTTTVTSTSSETSTARWAPAIPTTQGPTSPRCTRQALPWRRCATFLLCNFATLQLDCNVEDEGGL